MNDRWDLSYLYESTDDPKFQADFDSVAKQIAAIRTVLNTDAEPKTKLEQLVQGLERLNKTTDALGNFLNCTLAVDAMNSAANVAMDKLTMLSPELSMLSSAVERYVAAVPELDRVIASSPELESVRFALLEMAEHAAHNLPDAIEPWMLEMRLSGGAAFEQLRDKLDSTLKVRYRGEELPLAAVRGKAYDPDPQVRKDAYEAELAAYAQLELPMSYCLNNIKMEARTMAKAKGYDSVLDMTLAQTRMDRETLDAMWSAIREYLPDFRRYLRAKAKVLGHEGGLPFYDLFAPVGESEKTYTIEEAQAMLETQLGKFTPCMAAFIRHAFEHRWIDLYPRDGKTGGAFCTPVHFADRSLVMTNFQGSFNDVSTIAHELGHAWHNRCLAGLPYMMIDTPMPLAETASIFNETILSYQVLQSATESERFGLLEASLMDATQTVVDIYSRYLFENEVIDTRADHAMTVDELKDAMLRAQDASYGDGLAKDVRHPYMWACKSHYYSAGLNFYNFPYAFGLLFGKGVFAQYLQKGDAFVDDYCKLLRFCGSDTLANVAASVGIDVRSVDFWRSSLQVVKNDIDAFCALCEKQAK